VIRVACAIIRNEEKETLVVQRSDKSNHPFKWEFPGGKLKEGETAEECIIREIREELSMEIVICSRLQEVEYDYGFRQIVLIPFICDTLQELPLLSEHISFRWILPEHLPELDLIEADVQVARNYLEQFPGYRTEGHVDPVVTGIGFDEKELYSMIRGLRGMREAEFLAASASENPVLLGKILEYSFSGDRKLSFHASWALSKVCDKFPEAVIPILAGLIDSLGKIDDQSVERSFLRVLSLADLSTLDSRRQGILADHCFALLRSGFSAIAAKAYSMEILYKLALIYPDLIREFIDTINMLSDDGSAGVIARGKMVLKKLRSELKARGSSHSLI
jgi:8-oxo-dGTP diphosphatase